MRLCIRLNEAQGKCLEEMAKELGTTKVDIIRKALSFLAVAISERSDGNGVGIIRNYKVVKEIIGI